MKIHIRLIFGSSLKRACQLQLYIPHTVNALISPPLSNKPAGSIIRAWLLGVDYLICVRGGGGGGRGRGSVKNFLQSLYSKKIMQHEWLKKQNACTALKELPAGLASEKKKSCTNQFFHPLPPRSNSSPLKVYIYIYIYIYSKKKIGF